MTRYLNITFFLFFSLISAHQAQAGIMIEPYAGLGVGTFTETTKTSPITTFESKPTATTYGGRVGLSFLGLWVAGDYTSLATNLAYSKPIDTSTGTGIMKMTFIDAGYNFPFLFRVWGGYGFVNYQNIKYINSANANIEESFRGGTASKVGIGLSFLHFLSVNVEYMKPTFKKYEKVTNGVSAGEQDIDVAFSDQSQGITTVTLSFPINIL